MQHIKDRPLRDLSEPAATPGALSCESVSLPSDDPLTEQEQAYLVLLFNKYRGPLYRYLSRLVHSTEDVAELVQETYLRASRRATAVSFESGARAYLFQTATNVAREYYRRRARRHSNQHVGIEAADETFADDLPPEQDALRDEALARLRTEVKAMPEALREVLILNRFRNLTYSEIANALGVSTRTVERRMSQAMELLAARLRGLL